MVPDADRGSLEQRQEHDGCVVPTLNRPEKLNALTVAMIQQLRSQGPNR